MTETMTPPSTTAPVWSPPRRWLLLAPAGVGLLGDLAVRSGVTTVAMALLVVATSAALLVSGAIVNRHARLLIGAAPLFGMWVAIRTSPWLQPVDLGVSFGLLVLGTSLARSGSLADLKLVDMALRGTTAIGHLVLGPELVAPDLRRVRPAPAVLRGVAIAVPIVALFGALLASADAVFASFLRTDVNGLSLVVHVLFIGITAWTLLGLARIASTPDTDEGEYPRVLWLGATETTVVLASVVAVFGAFAVAQVLSISGAADHVLKTEGLTYAEYARSGFFQLLWVAGLTVVGLLALRAMADLHDERSQRRFVVLAEAVLALTLGIVATAIWRLHLYQDAYGLTMLRLVCIVFAFWLGVVMGLLGLWIAGVGASGRSWFPAAAGAAALVILFWFNAYNPEAVVVRDNLTHGRSVPVDVRYLGSLSDDAVPAAIELLPTLDPALRAQVLEAVGCPPDERESWADFNVAAAAAKDARRPYCPG